MDRFDPMVLESRISYRKTLETTVLVARAQENPVAILPENGVHENVVDAAAGSMEIRGLGGPEAAPYDLSHSTEHDATGKVGDGPEIQPAQEQGPTAVMESHGNGSLVSEPEHEGSDSGSPLKSPAGGTGGEAEGTSGGEKKRKNRTEWTDEQTGILLEAVSREPSCNSRFGRKWERIAKFVQGKNEKECRRRTETLTKSYNKINMFYDNKKLSGLDEEEFGNMMQAMPQLPTRFKLNWYTKMCEFRPPGRNKRRRKQRAGSPSANGMNSVPSASASCERVPVCLESHNPDPESTKVVVATPDEGNESKPPLEAFEEVFVLRSKGRGGDALTAERLSPAVELPRPFQRCFFFFSFLISLQLERHLDPNFHSNPAATVDEPLPAVCELHHDASPVLDLQNDCAAQAGLPYLGELHEDPSEVVPLTDIWVVVDASTAAPWTDFEGVADVDNLPDFEDLSLLPEF